MTTPPRSSSSQLREITIEQTKELYDMLTGRALPEGIEMGRKCRPKMTEEKAFGVIWFLQEHLRILPDHFERCDNCGDIFDDHREGHYSAEVGKHLAPRDEQP